MARCPFARQKILHPENESQGSIVPRAVLLHTAVDAKGDTDLAAYFDRGDIGAESHFYIHSNPGSSLDGVIDQMMDTTVEADANQIADKWAVSIETEDNSAGKTTIDPLTPKALASYLRLCEWLLTVHPTIPRRRCTSARLPGAAGFGYHSQPMRERFDGTSNNPWTSAQGKGCPGDGKVRQYENDIIPALLTPAPEEDELTPEDRQFITDLFTTSQRQQTEFLAIQEAITRMGLGRGLYRVSGKTAQHLVGWDAQGLFLTHVTQATRAFLIAGGDVDNAPEREISAPDQVAEFSALRGFNPA